MVIDAHYFLKRIGEHNERPKDRKFCARLAQWQYDHEWREARRLEDYARMGELERDYRWIDCL